MAGEDDPRQPAAPEGPKSFAEAMKEADEKPKSVLWLVATLLGLFAMGVHDFMAGAEPNGCAMTYMYEYPKYVPMAMTGEAAARFPKYGLYAYGEGEMVEDLRRGRFSGIPVLFIPGNSGSHKQVRSLASVALRKALDDRKDFHFDYFSVDFNEEFGALYGGSLERQADFVSLCVDHILGLYAGKGDQRRPSPESVVLVGHSIGGMVAKSLFGRPGFDARKASTVLTLATPHQPVMVPDWQIRTFYDAVDDYWDASRESGDLKDVTLVSVGGGVRDVQVRSGLANSPHADVNVAATSSPGTWVSTDHRCIAWCKQLVLSLNRALFDAVDRGTGQISKIASYRRGVFKYHLVNRTAGKKYKSKDMYLPKTMDFDKDGFWSDSLKRQFVFERTKVSENSHVMIKLLDDPKHRNVVVDAVNLANDNWIFGCKATTLHKNTRLCTNGDNLSDRTQLLPSDEARRKTATFDLHALARDHGYTHLVVFVPKKAENVRVHVDVFDRESEEPGPLRRAFSVESPRWITFWKSYPVVKETQPQAVFYNISIKGLAEPWQAYDIKVTRLESCQDSDHFGLMRFVTPWADDTTQVLIGEDRTSSITAMLQNPRPADAAPEDFRNPEVQLYLSPSCRYRIEIQAKLPKMWGQMIRFYAPMMLPLALAATLLTLVQQLKLLEKEGSCPSFLSVVITRVTPISVVMPSKLLSAALSSAYLAKYFPLTDFVRLSRQGIDFGVLPIVLFFVSIGLVTVLAACAWASVVVFGNVAHRTVSRLLTSRVTASDFLADAALAGLSKVPFVLSAVLIGLSASTCGTVAMCLGTFAHFLQLFYSYEDYLKLLIKEEVPDLEERKKRALSSMHFQFSISLLWALSTVSNAPSLMAWSRDVAFGDRSRLDPDPSLVLAVAAAASLPATWGDRAPRPLAKFHGRLAGFLQFLCILTVLYGSVSFYRVNFFLAAAFAGIGLHQLLAPNMTEEELAQVEEERKKAKEKEETAAANEGGAAAVDSDSSGDGRGSEEKD